MGTRKNCWEFMRCGLEQGGSRTKELGVCPTSILLQYDGINNGKSAGRLCWMVENTLCQGTVVEKFKKCRKCRFYMEVKKQEGDDFVLVPHFFINKNK